MFWLIFVIVVVVFAFAGVLGSFGDTSLRQYRFGLPRNIASVIWFVVLLLLGVAVYHALANSDETTSLLIGSLFLIQLLFFVAFFTVYHRFADFSNSLWAALILFFLALFTLWLMWQSGNGTASVYILIYLGWLAYEIFVLWQTLKQ